MGRIVPEFQNQDKVLRFGKNRLANQREFLGI